MTKDEYSRARAILKEQQWEMRCLIRNCPCLCAGGKGCIDNALRYIQTGDLECYPKDAEYKTTSEPLSQDEIDRLLFSISQGDA